MERKLIHFSVNKYQFPPIHIKFVDYSGHPAQGGGFHYTAVHEVRMTQEQLYDILEKAGVLVHNGGNAPDIVPCEDCGVEFFRDELEFSVKDYSFCCPPCRAKRKQRG